MALHEIRFLDLPDNERASVHALRTDQARLERLPNPTQAEAEELARIKKVLALVASGDLADPLFIGVRDLFSDTPGRLTVGLQNHQDGRLRPNGTWSSGSIGTTAPPELKDADVVWVSLVHGLLQADAVAAPRVRDDVSVETDKKDPRYRNFVKAFYAALGEGQSVFDLAALVLPLLRNEGDPDGRGGATPQVSTVEFAKVIRCLRDKGVTAQNPQQLRRRINECLDDIQAVGTSPSVADMSIELPNLNGITAYQIQAKNVEAMGPMVCAAMFDELKAFDVVDTILYQWQQGTLPIDVSPAGRMLYDYWKSAPNRMSEAERRGLYALTMGVPGGSVNGNGAVNRDFNDLWMRFVSSVSSLVRQKTVDQLLRQTIPAAVGQQQVRKAARDLASNLSRYAFGIVNYAARDLQDQINKMIALLDHEDIKRSFGSRDMWGVIDQVATVELGGPRNGAKYRTLATCGAIITKWLSQNVEKYNSASSAAIIDVADVVSQFPRQSPEPTKTPTDYDLVNACELWLADTAVSDAQIDDTSRNPRDTPAMTSRPVQIPSIARELLEQTLPGIGLSHGSARY